MIDVMEQRLEKYVLRMKKKIRPDGLRGDSLKRTKFFAILSLCLTLCSFVMLNAVPEPNDSQLLSFSATANEESASAAPEQLSGQIVYYVADGSKYHLDAACKSIAGKEVYSSDMIFANSGGRTLCSICQNRQEKETDSEIPDVSGGNPEMNSGTTAALTDPGTIVYRTASGKKYHLDRNCRYIRNRDNVSEISLPTAVESGLTPCSACAE